MKRFFALSLLSSVLALPMVANAAPAAWTKDGGGNINFTGAIKDDGCVVQGQGTSDINVPLGNVQLGALGTAASPGAVSSTGEVSVTVKCKTANTKVQMRFEPVASQLVGNNVLKVDNGSGAARNVGIVLLNAAGTAMNLSSESYTGDSSAGANNVTTLHVRATYVRTADLAETTVGIANASMPFVLEYQ